MKSLKEIEADVTSRAKLIGASRDQLPTYGSTRDFGSPHIEVDGSRYHYVVVERRQELNRRSTRDYDELLYWVFRSVTHQLAFDYELRNRIEDQDCRRIAFPKQVELLNLIDPEMGVRCFGEISQILRDAPYDDEPFKRVSQRSSGKIS